MGQVLVKDLSKGDLLVNLGFVDEVDDLLDDRRIVVAVDQWSNRTRLYLPYDEKVEVV